MKKQYLMVKKEKHVQQFVFCGRKGTILNGDAHIHTVGKGYSCNAIMDKRADIKGTFSFSLSILFSSSSFFLRAFSLEVGWKEL